MDYLKGVPPMHPREEDFRGVKIVAGQAVQSSLQGVLGKQGFQQRAVDDRNMAAYHAHLAARRIKNLRSAAILMLVMAAIYFLA